MPDGPPGKCHRLDLPRETNPKRTPFSVTTTGCMLRVVGTGTHRQDAHPPQVIQGVEEGAIPAVGEPQFLMYWSPRSSHRIRALEGIGVFGASTST